MHTGRFAWPRRARWLVPLAAGLLLAGLACGPWKRFLYEGIGRDRWQLPERVVEALAIEPGQHVADLGSGGGYFTFRLARATGPMGRVYAVDVDPALNRYVAERARELGHGQVVVVEAAHADPRLPADGVDLLFTCNTYHHLEDRSAYFRRVRDFLRPGGRVAVIDFREPGWILRRHSVPPEVIRSEMEAAGYRLVQEHDFLPRQGFLIFAPSAGRLRGASGAPRLHLARGGSGRPAPARRE